MDLIFWLVLVFGCFGAWEQSRLVDTAGCTQCYIPPGVGVVEVGWGWLGSMRGRSKVGMVERLVS